MVRDRRIRRIASRGRPAGLTPAPATSSVGPNRSWPGTERPLRSLCANVGASDAAYQSHRQTPHFQDYLKRTADMLQDKEAIAVVPSLLMNKGGLLYEAKE